MKKISFSQLTESKLGEFLLWLSVFILLTVNNARFSLTASLLLAFFSLLGMVGISFLNRFVLIPRLFKFHRNYLYVIASIVCILIFIQIFSAIDRELIHRFLPPFLHEHRPRRMFFDGHKPPFGAFDIMPLLKTGFTIVGSFLVTTLIHVISKVKQEEKRTQQLMTEKGLMELKFLKSQINPHFMFNALNNIYSMIYTGDKNAGNSVLKLSEMLRYVMDECQAELIPIEREIHYIENYIDFQQLRAENMMNVVFNKSIHNTQIQLPPMLFQPFVENCFKHSRIDQNPNSSITITLSENHDGLLFIAENTIPSQKLITELTKRDGIGINNVKKRLELLFPDNHSLEINKSDNLFRVKLLINLNSPENI
ncbi:sensor histidine kinase [Parabacteroides sp. FAFU027]|uniref:sensor histidine kinase n=1 Tax=Parabacteroides sp. FAFU027 TaxID=2922715 RepID=UPI001FAEFCBF|nr:histidine kinase [Parabacteroides sp. FAFU027]